MTDPVYVTLFRKWNERSKQWQPACNVSTDRPVFDEHHHMAVFALDGVKPSNAVDALIEWLYRGRPRMKTVRQVAPGRIPAPRDAGER